MRYVLVILALLGIIASSLALREHYRPYGESVCDINDHWDCGIVNHSPYAMLHGIPVADIGIAGYFLLGILALKRMYKTMLVLAVPALAFSLYLAHIEKDVLGVWCLYCAISLGVISLIALLLVGTVMTRSIGRPTNP
jgi:vitamin-K-epoxide reductase (warfarin-sensitive)